MGPAERGVSLSGGDSSAVLTHVSVQGSGEEGLRAYLSGGLSCTDCSIRGTGSYGILALGSQEVVLDRVAVRATEDAGVWVQSHVQLAARELSIEDARLYGLSVYDAEARIVDSQVRTTQLRDSVEVVISSDATVHMEGVEITSEKACGI